MARPGGGNLLVVLDRLHATSRRVDAWVDSRATVPVAAVLACLLRLPGTASPLGADESGFTLVARQWEPRPDSVYGDLFVDRHPLVIAVYGLLDTAGGPHLVRVVGALLCAVTVYLAAAVARTIGSERAARWTAVAVASLLASAIIDAVAVKGEVLALPLSFGAVWCALHAVERRSPGLALAGALLATTALGLKQSLVGGLAFGGVLLVTAWATRRLPGRDLGRLLVAAAAGVAVPVLLTVVWAVAVGVDLDVLWYTVYGFRADAAAVLTASTSDEPVIRAVRLAGAALATGMVLVLAGFVVHLRREWRADPAVTAATLAMLLADGAALVAGGSYWLDYLFQLVPATALGAGLLARHRTGRGRTMRVVIAASAVSALLAQLGHAGVRALDVRTSGETATGAAIRDAAEPGDTLVVFGGRPDLQLQAGLPTPYRHLWSLPMRTLDHGYDELRALVSGPDAPTWFVAWVPLGAWGAPGAEELLEAVEERYRVHGLGCHERPVLLREDVVRPPVEPDC